MTFINDNNAERMNFVELWAEYVLNHSDIEWSVQQNVLINSCLKSARMTRKEYLAMKG
ncbi:TPA: hypothetical protein HA235_00805 [Candidatus Woesearchaeota archaeon]|nr:hypothetical protein [Candidatus Woesearchaeota archaeon]HIH31224.1 hypothetical protein [Candidatus Woesearchaeota archaeon]HIH55515.1 hypothetical protein [Candidatus Woesearchaeota archaeon]HIJ02664.1 hypothetical protein [Candidatus Woesearchaeota archaeon]HIJ13223.1 hypothetical protein [Candidatus Woesearchaeota archaeon]